MTIGDFLDSERVRRHFHTWKGHQSPELKDLWDVLRSFAQWSHRHQYVTYYRSIKTLEMTATLRGVGQVCELPGVHGKGIGASVS